MKLQGGLEVCVQLVEITTLFQSIKLAFLTVYACRLTKHASCADRTRTTLLTVYAWITLGVPFTIPKPERLPATLAEGTLVSDFISCRWVSSN